MSSTSGPQNQSPQNPSTDSSVRDASSTPRETEHDLFFQDFVPSMLSDYSFFKVAEYETFEAAVAAANAWLQEEPVVLVHLETVVLPNIWSKHEEGTTDGSLGTSSASTSHWHQFLRVWYRRRPRPTAPADRNPSG